MTDTWGKKRLVTLYEDWKGCTKCPLHTSRPEDTAIAFGDGAYNADFLFIEAAPNAYDVGDGYFSPHSERGALFLGLLEAAGIDARQTFRTALVGCRPYVVLPATEEQEAQEQDRAPMREELATCEPRITDIIYTVDPYIIVAMGDLPWKSLVESKNRKYDTTIAKAVSTSDVYDCWIPGKLRPVRYPVLPIYSLDHMVKNPSAASHAPIAVSVDQLTRAKRHIEVLKGTEQL